MSIRVNQEYGGLAIDSNSTGQAIGTTETLIDQFDTLMPFTENVVPALATSDITVALRGDYFVEVDFSATTDTASSVWNFYVYVNGAAHDQNYQADATFNATPDEVHVSISGILTLEADDTVELFAVSDAPAQTITLSSAQLSLSRYIQK
jgi:hypothetical protein